MRWLCIFIVILLLTLGGCGRDAFPSEKKIEDPIIEEEISGEMMLTIAGKQVSVRVDQNSTVLAFQELLPLTLTMQDLNQNEKFVYLDQALPAKPKQVNMIRTGDLMLYGDDCLVLFYKDVKTNYPYTRIGWVEDVSSVQSLVGTGTIEVRLDQSNQTD